MFGHTTYLVIDLATIAVPLIFSFHPRIGFVKAWKAFWPACLLAAALFVSWDMLFTHLGFWGFNDRYVLAPRVAGLPIEELLFFICVPYACVFTYFAIRRIWTKERWSISTMITVAALFTTGLVIAIVHWDRWYTATTFTLLAALLLALALWSRPAWLSRALVSYALVLPLFFLVNGLLTGSWLDEPVVWYNDAENLGVRIGTIPLEDAFYGLLLVLLNITLFEGFHRKTID